MKRLTLPCTAALMIGALTFASGVRADDSKEALTGAPVILFHPSVDTGRAELRRALVSADDGLGEKRERRQLSREERDALSQELRRAVREAYQKRARSAQ